MESVSLLGIIVIVQEQHTLVCLGLVVTDLVTVLEVISGKYSTTPSYASTKPVAAVTMILADLYIMYHIVWPPEHTSNTLTPVMQITLTNTVII